MKRRGPLSWRGLVLRIQIFLNMIKFCVLKSIKFQTNQEDQPCNYSRRDPSYFALRASAGYESGKERYLELVGNWLLISIQQLRNKFLIPF